jgi:uncharacterized protein involved in exopolysaccharide biosynthesis
MNVAAIPNASASIGIARPPVIIRRYALRDFLTAVFYHRRIMLLAFVVPVALGVAAAAYTKPAYVGQARLIVLYGSEYFYQPSAGQPGFSVALDRNEIMLGELQVLKSTSLAMETLQGVGVDRVYPGTNPSDPAAMQKAAARMANDLSLSSIAQSNILELSFRSYDPAVATDVLRTLIADYLTRRAAIFQRAPSTGAQADQASFLARLHTAEDALSDFAQAHGIANIEQQLDLLLQQQYANRLSREQTGQSVAETSAKLAVINDELAHLPATIQAYVDSDRSQQTQLLTESLLHLQMKRRDLASRYNDSFPEIQSLDRQIQWAQASLAGTPARDGAITRQGPNPLHQDLQSQEIALQAQLKGLQAKEGQLAVDAATVDTRIRDLSLASNQYRDLKRNRDVLDDTYRAFVKSNEETQMADNAERNRAANIRVIQAPDAAPASLSMRKILVGGGIVVGLFAALAAMTLCNALRQVFVTARDASVGLELPVLATVAKRGRRGTPNPATMSELPAQWAEPPVRGGLGA